MCQRLFCASLVLVMFADRAPAQTALDLIPTDALAGLAIRSIDNLTRKGDQFIKDTGMKVPLPRRKCSTCFSSRLASKAASTRSAGRHHPGQRKGGRPGPWLSQS